jgi:hypothetical protein
MAEGPPGQGPEAARPRGGPAVARAPADLAARLDRILGCAEGLIRQAPAEVLEHGPAGRPAREVAYRLFRVALGLADAMDTGRFPRAWLDERAPADLRDGPAIARYGALVRARLAGWFEGAGPGELVRVIEAPDGPRSCRELLERTAWHAAQHLRLLYAVLEERGVRPPRPLPATEVDGLPRPASPW